VIRLAIRVARDSSELVLAELLELAPSGVEEVELDEDHVEYAVYGPPGELPELPDLNAAAGQTTIEISTTEVPDDWPERWKRFHKPVLIPAPIPTPTRTRQSGHQHLQERLQPERHQPERPQPSEEVSPTCGLRVRPPWERSSSALGTKEIVIDPAQAFGTGAHATTRLCLELLLELAASHSATGPLLDVGTGSGILAIASAKLGYHPVLALDHDPQSLAAATANASANDVQIEVQRFDLRTQPLPRFASDVPSQPVVLANLLAPLFTELERSMTATPSQLIASGLLCAELDQVVELLGGRLGMVERARKSIDEWAAVWLSDPCGAAAVSSPRR
jgi:ribosomal protein L11 methyltransferase